MKASSAIAGNPSNDWRRLRRQCFNRDENRCQRCHTGADLTAHHLRPRSSGGADIIHNLITLCGRCHDWAEVEIDNRGRPLSRADIIGSDEILRPKGLRGSP